MIFYCCQSPKIKVEYLKIGSSSEENFNVHLGKLRLRRLSLGLTQTKVAQAINVTFQQIKNTKKELTVLVLID